MGAQCLCGVCMHVTKRGKYLFAEFLQIPLKGEGIDFSFFLLRVDFSLSFSVFKAFVRWLCPAGELRSSADRDCSLRVQMQADEFCAVDAAADLPSVC